MRLPWVSMAPLGRPVVPPVYCSSATSSTDGSGQRRGGCGAVDEPRQRDHVRPVGQGRAGRIAAPFGVLADDDAVQQPGVEQARPHRQEVRAQIGGDERAGAAVAQLVGQHALGVERAEMHDPRARAGWRRRTPRGARACSAGRAPAVVPGRRCRRAGARPPSSSARRPNSAKLRLRSRNSIATASPYWPPRRSSSCDSVPRAIGASQRAPGA